MNIESRALQLLQTSYGNVAQFRDGQLEAIQAVANKEKCSSYRRPVGKIYRLLYSYKAIKRRRQWSNDHYQSTACIDAQPD